MFNYKFTKLHNLKIYDSPILYAKLANGYNVPICGEVKAIPININTFKSSIGGLVIDNTSHSIIAAMDWFSRNNPFICWKTKVMTIHPNGVNYKIMQDVIDKILQDTILCQIINTDDSDEISDTSNLTFIKYSMITTESNIPKTNNPQIDKILLKYQLVFKEELTKLPPDRGIKHKIELSKVMPKPPPLYQLSPTEALELEKFIKTNLEKGFIQPSDSPWSAPVFFIKKKEGGLQLVTNYWALNKATIKNCYPLPLIEELFSKLTGTTIFSKINLTAGYNQVLVKPADIPKTAFKLPLEHMNAS